MLDGHYVKRHEVKGLVVRKDAVDGLLPNKSLGELYGGGTIVVEGGGGLECQRRDTLRRGPSSNCWSKSHLSRPDIKTRTERD